jgi:hypothetical protein
VTISGGVTLEDIENLTAYAISLHRKK